MKSDRPEFPNSDEPVEGAKKKESPESSEALPVNASSGEPSPTGLQSSELVKAGETPTEAQPIDPPPEPPALEEPQPKPPAESKASDEILEEWANHYTDQFRSGVNRTNTILVTWGASMLLIFVGLLPLWGKAAKYQERYAKYQVDLKMLAFKEKERPESLKKERFALKKKVRNPTDAYGDAKAAKRKELINQDNDKIEAIDEALNALPEEFKQQHARLDARLSDIKLLKRDFAFSLPLGKLDIPVAYTPLMWVVLFTAFVVYLLYKRIVLIGAMAKVLHIQIDLRRKEVDALKGMGSAAPFWIAPLPTAFSGSSISGDVLRRFLGWEPNAIGQSFLTYMFLALNGVVFIWGAILSLQVVRINDNPQLEVGLRICLSGTFVFLVVLSWFWLRPRINLQSYPETLMIQSRRRRVLLGLFSSATVFGYFYVLAPRRVFPAFLQPDSDRAKRLVKLTRQRRRVVPEASLRGTYQVNKFSNIMHYIRSDGRMKSLGGDPAKIEFGAGKQFVKYDKTDVIKILGGSPEQASDEGTINQLRAYPSGAKTATRMAPVVAVSSRSRRTVRSSPAIPPRIARGEVGTIAEALAIEKVQGGEIPDALTILWTGIASTGMSSSDYRRSKSNYRLYDLIAFLAIKHGQLGELKELIDLVSDEPKGNPALERRVQKWNDWIQNPNNSSTKWSAKVKSEKKTWNMPKNSM